MNKTFKVIWNAATQSWVAVSEFARGKTKSSSKAISASIIAAGLTVSAINVEAANFVQGDGAQAN